MKTIISGLFLLATCLQLPAQLVNQPVLSACFGSTVYSPDHADGFSFMSNPASLAPLKNTSVGVSGSRRFLLADLSEYSAAVVVPTAAGSFGVKMHYAGSMAYNETQAGLGYGRKLGSKADAGILIGYNAVHLAGGYGAASFLHAEAGAVFHISSRLHTGFHFSRPAGKYGKDKTEEALPAYHAGVGYEPSSGFLFSVEFEKTETQPVNINAAILYQPVPGIQVRAGIATATSSFWFGSGIGLALLRLYVFAKYHPQLGISPGLCLQYQLKKNK